MDTRQQRFEAYAPDPDSVKALADDHPAIVGKTTMFPTTIKSATESERLLIDGHNSRKVGRKVTKGPWSGMQIYTLTLTERATCASTCHMWNTCYGNAMPFARRHAAGPEFEARLGEEVAEAAKKHPEGFVVRLHVLGDFYSPEYVRLWRSWLGEFPELHIYGYTAAATSTDKLWWQITGEIEQMNEAYPDQCFIRFSDAEPTPGGATVIDYMPDGPKVEEGTVCAAELEKSQCCATCGMCWSPALRDETIVFIKHGLGSNQRASASMAKKASVADDDFGMRRIQPLDHYEKLAGVMLSKPPMMMWVAPTELWIDTKYQRALSRASMKLIGNIIEGWNWQHYKPPICCRVGDRIHVIDGQHTAIAAATHPHVDQIPIMIVDTDTIIERAQAFVGHNKNRISVTPYHIHKAGVAAGDSEAVALDKCMEDAGFNLLPFPPSNGTYKPGDSLALRAARMVMKDHGVLSGTLILETMVRSKRAPIRADDIRACAHLLMNRNRQPAEVAAAIASLDDQDALAQARKASKETGIKMHEALSSIYARAISKLPPKPLPAPDAPAEAAE